ncbi:MAG TPA: rod shape-determining protein MreC [Candidatus Pelethocola excrementipullorum]|nr:rod shape-determining protein MreC [Candidatus Pelethocola excrementipullorum]
MKKKKKFQMNSKHLLMVLTFVCISAAALTFTNVVSVGPIRNAVGYVIVPFQNGINQVGKWLTHKGQRFQNAEQLAEENDELKERVNALMEQNNLLTQNQNELSDLKQLYQLDKEYSEYEKVAAEVIASDPGNWFNTFTINRGSNHGIEKDMNVISDGGLVGLVTEVGADWATVRSIIDDFSNVSAMTVSTSDTCIVSGDLRLMDEGKLSFSQMSSANSVTVGEKIVTSDISDKYLKGILIGYVSEVTEDPNHLTNTGYLIPVVDFEHISKVLVIKQLKQTGGN